MLADAYADGRLTREEYDDRLNTLYGSRTLGEIPSLVTDLVPPDGPPTAPAPPLAAELRTRGARKWRKDVEESFAAFLVPSIICTVIWIAVTGRGFFWPVFPMSVPADHAVTDAGLENHQLVRLVRLMGCR
jgi:hypothetical protein